MIDAREIRTQEKVLSRWYEEDHAETNRSKGGLALWEARYVIYIVHTEAGWYRLTEPGRKPPHIKASAAPATPNYILMHTPCGSLISDSLGVQGRSM